MRRKNVSLKDKASRLNKPKTSPPKKEEEKNIEQGFNVGAKKGKIKRVTFTLDEEHVAFLDDITHKVKRITGKRLAASEVVRTAINILAQFDEQEQIKILTD